MLDKAILSKLPQSNTSDTEKSLIKVHSKFLSFIAAALDECGL